MSRKEIKQEILDAFKSESDERSQGKSKKTIDNERSTELALAISIILANLSSEEEFVKTLLGICKWKGKDKKQNTEPKRSTHSSRNLSSLQLKVPRDSNFLEQNREESKIIEDSAMIMD